MTKSDFEELAVKSGFADSKVDASRIVDAFLGTLEEMAKKGGDVTFVGFGKFYTKTSPAKEGVVPGTNKKYKSKAKKKLAFKPGKRMGDI
jgi:DNA-binding protein HU-beta